MSNFLTKVKTGLAKLRVFHSVFGVSAALVFLVLIIGAPHAAHAGFWADLIGNVSNATFGLIFRGIGYVIMMLANFLIYLVGMLFNQVIIYTVFQFGNYFGNSAGLLAGWGALRDVANIILIFGFVMLGLATILDIHGYEVKKTLPRLIIFAILLNFSLLASEAVIDTANAFAALLYTQASQTCTSGTDQSCASQGSTDGISGAIFQLSGISSSFNVQDAADPAKDTDNTHYAIAYIGMAIFITVLAVVLLAGAIMLISRGIILAMLMILSPLGFAGLAVPPLEKYAKDWWHRLISQAFFAPLYLLLILVGLKVAQGVAGPNRNLLSALTTGDATAIGSIVIFSILAGFMVAALMVAKQMAGAGAGAVNNFIGRTAGTVAFGTAGFVGRRTAGRLSHRVSHDIKSGHGVLGRLQGTEWGRRISGAADKAAHSSYDLRATKAGATIASQTGINFGKAGGKGGYHATLDTAKKARDKYAEGFTLNHDDQHELDAARYTSWDLGRQIAQRKAAGATDDELKDLKEAKKEADSTAARIASKVQDAQMAYANNLENNIFNRLRNPGTLFTRTAGTEFRKGAASSIRARVMKSPKDHLIDQLNKALKEPKDEEKHDDHKPAPAPAAAPAAAAGGGGDHGHGGGH